MPDSLKTIRYRGGLITFRIPATWIEEYEEQGGGTFFESGPDTGTLRLNVLTMQSPSEVNHDTPVELLLSLPQAKGREVRRLPNGNALLRFDEPTQERGEKLVIHYWLVANPVPPKHARLANFSFTILASQAEKAKIHEQIRLLDKEISESRFHATIGR
jgi:hypothetical protein